MILCGDFNSHVGIFDDVNVFDTDLDCNENDQPLVPDAASILKHIHVACSCHVLGL